MSNLVFMVGHGVQYLNDNERTVPSGVTLNFAVPAGWISTGGLSTGHLRRAQIPFSETVQAGGKYQEHFLCPDDPNINARKLQAFFDGKTKGLNDSNCWICCTRGPNEVALSVVIERLRRILDDMVVVWTCCRSPLGSLAKGTLFYESGALKPKESQNSGNVMTSPTVPHHNVHLNSAEGLLTVLSADDVHAAGDPWAIKPAGQLSVLGDDRQKLKLDEVFGDPRVASQTMGNMSIAY